MSKEEHRKFIKESQNFIKETREFIKELRTERTKRQTGYEVAR
jgi:hypothetical protein